METYRASEADLEAALVRAVLDGHGPAVVEALRIALSRRQGERAGNVTPIGGRRTPKG